LALRVIIGVASFVIGWTGASVLTGLLLYEISKVSNITISQGVSSVISVAVGALLGAIPFGLLGAKWASTKWRLDENVRAKTGSNRRSDGGHNEVAP
jgi:hypothetical protein